MKLLLIILFIPFKLLSQDSIVWYMNDSVVNRTVIDGNYWINDNYTCEKLNDAWYYYRSDTVYQKIVFNANGHMYYNFDGNIWHEGIRCVIYDIPTQYNVILSNVIINVCNQSAHIKSKEPIKHIKIFDLSGKLLREMYPNDTNVSIRFNCNKMLIFDIDNSIHKLLIK